jgi:hypothetical protein
MLMRPQTSRALDRFSDAMRAARAYRSMNKGELCQDITDRLKRDWQQLPTCDIGISHSHRVDISILVDRVLWTDTIRASYAARTKSNGISNNEML